MPLEHIEPNDRQYPGSRTSVWTVPSALPIVQLPGTKEHIIGKGIYLNLLISVPRPKEELAVRCNLYSDVNASVYT